MFCKHCGSEKSASDFYISCKTKCKECIKSAVRKNRADNIEYYKEFDRGRSLLPHRVSARAAYRKTEAYAESHAAATKRWSEKYPERRKASTLVGNAIRDGRLVPWPACAAPDCECTKVEGHHPDYSRPLDVVWLCDKHHKEAHSIVRRQ